MSDFLRRFIACVSRLVPSWSRREFRAEWDAELANACVEPTMTRSWRDQRRLARHALGAVPDAWYLARQHWRPEMILQDIRFALRLMRLRAGYTAIVIVTLALSIGASTAMFSAIHAVLLRPLPFKEPSRLVKVWENDRLNQKPRYAVAPANYDDWRNQTRTFEQLAAYFTQGGTLAGSVGEPFHANVGIVTPNFFEALGVTPALGRQLTAADGVPPDNRLLILSHAVWQTHFGSDRSVIDRTVQFGGKPYRIVAVMPAGFTFPDRSIDVWQPLGMRAETLATRAQHFFDVIGRIKPSVTLEQARGDLESVAIAAQKKYPETNDQRGTTMVPLQEAVVGDVRQALYLLGAAVGLLLLIACANVANLMLVQSAARRRELAVRSARRRRSRRGARHRRHQAARSSGRRLRAANDGRPDGSHGPHVRAGALARDGLHLCRAARDAGVAQQRAARPSGGRARIDRRRALDAQFTRRDRICRRNRSRRRRGVVAREFLARPACPTRIRGDTRADGRDRVAAGSLRR
jgi:hypothetical protein